MGRMLVNKGIISRISSKTLSTSKGICYDFANLFTALCRSQNVPCYVVDGDKRDNAQYRHAWNRITVKEGLCRTGIDLLLSISNYSIRKHRGLY